MTRKNTIRLLLINGSNNDTELLVSLFRSAGRVARAQRVDSANELEKTLSQAWDLLIADDNHPELKVEACLDHLRQARVDFPVLVLRDSSDTATLFAAGAADIIAPADHQRLIGAALRELDNAEQRRSIAALKQQLEEAEQRSALLLGNAAEAIAYVADGMVINANAVFAERFGYASADDIDCAPVVDLLSATEQERFKTALKNNVEAEFSCTGQRSDGETFAANVQLRNATYEGDPCTQLIVLDAAETAASGSSNLDADSGFYSRGYLLEQIEQRDNGWLIVLEIEDFAALRGKLGLSASFALTGRVAEFIRERQAFGPACMARVADDAFAVLLEAGSAERMQQAAIQLCAAVSEHPFQPALTIRAGIAAFSRSDAKAALDQAFSAAEQADADNQRVCLLRKVPPAHSGTQAHSDAAAMLEDALHEQRFVLLYQPIISLRGTSGEHYETQLRMHGSKDTLELPDNFIESLGISADNAKLDRWILIETTKELAANRAKGNDTRLLINLTGSALQDRTLPSWLGVALKAAGLPPQSLILQLREIDVLNDIEAARAFAKAVQQIGCQIAIGGFGRVQDANKTLQGLTPNLVQLDSSFTRSLLTNGDVQTIRDLVQTASAMDVKTIVPFVENASVLATLWQVGADFIQGHYLQAPSREMNYEFTDIA